MLTEKEKMQRAKLYMLKLSDGINPVDDKKINDTVYGSERLSKCFLYIAEVLEGVISENKSDKVGNVKSREKTPFEITDEQLKKVHISSNNLVISEFVNEINKTTDNPNMKNLQPKQINDWLVNKGYLKNQLDSKGHIHRELTEKSEEIGIISKVGTGTFGQYTIILYSETAQKFLIKNMHNILSDII